MSENHHQAERGQSNWMVAEAFFSIHHAGMVGNPTSLVGTHCPERSLLTAQI